MAPPEIAKYKVILLGDSSVGKSNLALRYVRNTSDTKLKPTIGVEFFTKLVQIDNKKVVKCQIWDTAGQERFEFISTIYFRDAAGALLVYDVSDYASFHSIQKWLKFAKENCGPKCNMILVGNKIDLPTREVPSAKGQEFAQKHGISFIETSAIDTVGTGVNATFLQLVKQIHHSKSSQIKRTHKEENTVKVVSAPFNPCSKEGKSC